MRVHGGENQRGLAPFVLKVARFALVPSSHFGVGQA